MTAHTRGPWKVNKYGSIGAGENGHEPIVANVEPFYGTDRKHGDHQANARLIAAAPKLLEALKALNDVLCTTEDTRESRHKGREALIAARSAIREATGE